MSEPGSLSGPRQLWGIGFLVRPVEVVRTKAVSSAVVEMESGDAGEEEMQEGEGKGEGQGAFIILGLNGSPAPAMG